MAFRIARRRFGETTYYRRDRQAPVFSMFLDRATVYSTRAAARGALTRLLNRGVGGRNDDFYILDGDRLPPWL